VACERVGRKRDAASPKFRFKRLYTVDPCAPFLL
jgi:hypothetical protein